MLTVPVSAPALVGVGGRAQEEGEDHQASCVVRWIQPSQWGDIHMSFPGSGIPGIQDVSTQFRCPSGQFHARVSRAIGFCPGAVVKPAR